MKDSSLNDDESRLFGDLIYAVILASKASSSMFILGSSIVRFLVNNISDTSKRLPKTFKVETIIINFEF